MKKLFEIPVYAVSPTKLNSRTSKRISELRELYAHLDADMAAHAIDAETFPMRSWDYNHIIGYIRIALSKSDILFDVFLPLPFPNKYVWTTTRKHLTQNICANGTHIYLGTLKNNDDIRHAVATMLDQVITDHIPARFYVDKAAFEATNGYLDYMKIIQDL